MLEAWLALTRVKYHDNLLILMLFNQWLALTMLRAAGPGKRRGKKIGKVYLCEIEQNERALDAKVTVKLLQVLITNGNCYWVFSDIVLSISM